MTCGDRIIEGIIRGGMALEIAERQVRKARRVVEGNRVAILDECPVWETLDLLRVTGVRAVVFTHNNDVCVIRCPFTEVRMDHPRIRGVIQAAQEETEWRANATGSMFVREAKNTDRPSRVNVETLARAVETALQSI